MNFRAWPREKICLSPNMTHLRGIWICNSENKPQFFVVKRRRLFCFVPTWEGNQYNNYYFYFFFLKRKLYDWPSFKGVFAERTNRTWQTTLSRGPNFLLCSSGPAPLLPYLLSWILISLGCSCAHQEVRLRRRDKTNLLQLKIQQNTRRPKNTWR